MALLHAVRTALKDKNVRVGDLFKDYDPLRVGYITRSQFVRFAAIELAFCEFNTACKRANHFPSSFKFNFHPFTCLTVR